MTCPHCFSDNTEYLQRGIWHCWDCGCGFHEMALNNYHYWTAPWEMHEHMKMLDDCVLVSGKGLYLDQTTNRETVASMEGNS